MVRRNTSVPFEQRVTCTVREAEGYSGFGNTKVWNLIASGRLKSTKVDGTRLIYVKSLLALLGADTSIEVP